MSLEHRLKQAFSSSTRGLDESNLERDLHVLIRQGRRGRRQRRLGAFLAAAALLIAAAFVIPRALDAIRSLGDGRPASPQEPLDEPGVIRTVVGIGDARSSGDGGLAVNAAVRYPFDLEVDGAGNLYILENGRVRKVDGSGRISTVVGPPAAGASTALTQANQLRIGKTAHDPTNALAIDAEGDLYVGGGEGGHFMVNRISPSGQVARVAGTGRSGFAGDGGPAIDAQLGWVYDLAVDRAGNVYISDGDNDRIRMVDTSGVITTIAGTGEAGWSGDGGPAIDARLDHPGGIAVDGSGNIYFTQGPSLVRRIDAVSGVITTIAGTGKVGYAGDGGQAIDARMNAPEHVAVDDEGNVYVEDTGNNCIRVIDTDGIMTTIVGMRGRGFAGDGGQARLARLSEPSGMLLTADGILYIADSGNNRVRRVVL